MEPKVTSLKSLRLRKLLALLGPSWFFWVLLGKFLLTLLGLIGPYVALLGRILGLILGLTWPYWVLLSLTVPY